MLLIDIDAFRKEHKMNEHCEDCERNSRECQYNDFSMMDFCGWLDDAPTVDAVPVIRCKGCINWDTNWTTHPPEHYCPAIDQFTSADFYCGYAEKKDLEEVSKCTSTDTEH